MRQGVAIPWPNTLSVASIDVVNTAVQQYARTQIGVVRRTSVSLQATVSTVSERRGRLRHRVRRDDS